MNAMNSSEAPVPADADARREVLAEAAARSGSASLRPASLLSGGPLRPLPAAVQSKLDARTRAGLEPAGADHPRREAGQWVVLPVVTGAAAAVVLIVAEVISHTTLAIVAGIVLAASVVAGVGLRAWVQADPFRWRHHERRAITDTGHWESRQTWIGAVHDAPERALVGVAADQVARIAANPAWSSPYLDAHRTRFDLLTELDQIDAQAYLAASGHTARPADPSTDPSYLAVVDRVAALRGYAQALDVLNARLAASAASVDASLRRGAFGSSAAPGDYATDGVRQLTAELNYLNASIAEQIAATQTQPGLTSGGPQ
jgi:hypothetical protein